MRNRTQFRRHAVPPEPGIQPTRQGQAIHHNSSHFITISHPRRPPHRCPKELRSKSGIQNQTHSHFRTLLPRVPYLHKPEYKFKTKPVVRRGFEIEFGFQNARADRRRYRGAWEIGFGLYSSFCGHIARTARFFVRSSRRVRGCARSNSGNLAMLLYFGQSQGCRRRQSGTRIPPSGGADPRISGISTPNSTSSTPSSGALNRTLR